MSDWISIFDELPDVGKTVLVAYDLDAELAEFDEDHIPDWVAGLWKRSTGPMDSDAEKLNRMHGMTHWQRIEFPSPKH